MKTSEAVWIVERKVHAAKCPYCGEQNTTDIQCRHFVYRDRDHHSVFHFGKDVHHIEEKPWQE